jgi:hypothetical protein
VATEKRLLPVSPILFITYIYGEFVFVFIQWVTDSISSLAKESDHCWITGNAGPHYSKIDILG